MTKRKTKTVKKQKMSRPKKVNHNSSIPKVQETFHIGIKEPIPLRRNILESVKITVQAMQQFEKLKSIRSKKKVLIDALNKDIKNISKLMNSLKSSLPATNYKPKAPKIIKMPEQEIEKKPKVPKQVHKTEIDKLQDELNDIENQLNNLG